MDGRGALGYIYLGRTETVGVVCVFPTGWLIRRFIWVGGDFSFFVYPTAIDKRLFFTPQGWPRAGVLSGCLLFL